MIQLLLLIVWIYLSIMFTLFFIYMAINDEKIIRMKVDMKKRDIKLDKILHLSYKIDTKLHINK